MKDEKYQGGREFQELFAYASKQGEKHANAKLNAKEIVPQLGGDRVLNAVWQIGKQTANDYNKANRQTDRQTITTKQDRFLKRLIPNNFLPSLPHQ